ncbi:MAG TPA: hypothetical protein VIF82_09905 [Burkholderiaceae bacterium]|jgi:hypothetical protein
MVNILQRTCAVLLALTLLGVTAGCGGNGGGSSSGSTSGLSTPASVSVVSAN